MNALIHTGKNEEAGHDRRERKAGSRDERKEARRVKREREREKGEGRRV